MFCSKCGMQLSDDAAFCPSCGTLQGSQPVAQTIEQPMAQPAASTGKKISLSKNAKLALIGGVALAVILVIVLLVSGGGPGYGSPEDLAIHYVEARCTYDIEAVVDCVGDWAIRDAAEDMGASPYLSRSEFLDVYEKYLASEIRYTPVNQEVEILNVTVTKFLYGDDIDWDDYELTIEERASILRGAKVEVTYMVNGEVDTLKIECVESDGKWFYWD